MKTPIHFNRQTVNEEKKTEIVIHLTGNVLKIMYQFMF